MSKRSFGLLLAKHCHVDIVWIGVLVLRILGRSHVNSLRLCRASVRARLHRRIAAPRCNSRGSNVSGS